MKKNSFFDGFGTHAKSISPSSPRPKTSPDRAQPLDSGRGWARSGEVYGQGEEGEIDLACVPNPSKNGTHASTKEF